jgi:glutamate dehydrogenase/leucine dehydrogenase
MPARKKKSAKSQETPLPAERRSNHALREVLDELIDHIRNIARSRETMPAQEIEYAQQRLEWLADELWRLSTEEYPQEP